MYQSQQIFRALDHSYILINPDFSIKDVTDSVVKKLNLEREEILKMDVKALPSDGKLTPVFSEAGKIEFLLYEFNPSEDIRKDFLSTASHELRTPLTALKLQVQLAKKMINSEERPLTPAQMKKFVDRANHDVTRLSQIVEDMLLATNSKESEDEEKKTWFNLEEFMEDFVEDAQEFFKDFTQRVSVSVTAPEMVYWNQGQISQTIINLISNAYRFGDGTPVHLSVTSGGGIVYISVEDQGPGISKEEQKKLFNMFAKGSTRKSGLGLGLYNCKKIVRGHKGKITVSDGRDGRGTRIDAVIPVNPKTNM